MDHVVPSVCGFVAARAGCHPMRRSACHRLDAGSPPGSGARERGRIEKSVEGSRQPCGSRLNTHSRQIDAFLSDGRLFGPFAAFLRTQTCAATAVTSNHLICWRAQRGFEPLTSRSVV